jgi:hypothetical protein
LLYPAELLARKLSLAMYRGSAESATLILTEICF